MSEDALETEEGFPVTEKVNNLLSICAEQMFSQEEMLQLAVSSLRIVYDDFSQELASLQTGDESQEVELDEFATTISNMTRIHAATDVLSEIILEDISEDDFDDE